MIAEDNTFRRNPDPAGRAKFAESPADAVGNGTADLRNALQDFGLFPVLIFACVTLRPQRRAFHETRTGISGDRQ